MSIFIKDKYKYNNSVILKFLFVATQNDIPVLILHKTKELFKSPSRLHNSSRMFCTLPYNTSWVWIFSHFIHSYIYYTIPHNTLPYTAPPHYTQTERLGITIEDPFPATGVVEARRTLGIFTPFIPWNKFFVTFFFFSCSCVLKLLLIHNYHS